MEDTAVGMGWRCIREQRAPRSAADQHQGTAGRMDRWSA